MAPQTAAEFVPDSLDLDELSEPRTAVKAATCTWTPPRRYSAPDRPNADLMLVGEQPGDQEDKAGEPFVGPAGRLLDKALVAAGVDRDRLYVTNAVKHFKFTLGERGKRRIHKTPSRTEVVSCRPWLLAEMRSVQPDVLMLLGATAAQSLMGSAFRLTAHRGEVLRLPDADELEFDPSVVVSRTPVLGVARSARGP